MTSPVERDPLELRLLVLAPIGRDATLTASVLQEADIVSVPCADMTDLLARLEEGAGAILIAEEALIQECRRLAATLGTQPTWSDLPLVILTRSGGDSPIVADAVLSLGNVTLLERPTRVATLVSVVRTALRARARQYQVRDHLIERQRAEEKLRDSETTFRILGEAVPDFLWMSDAHGTPLYQNPAWHQYTGWSHQDLTTKGWETLPHPDDVEPIKEAWGQAVRTGAPFEIEYRIKRHDGVYRWFLARTVPVKDADGHVVKWVGTTTYIHDRKQAEESLKEADRRKDEFLATLAHELRNPLAPIRNSLHILRLTCRDNPAGERVGEVIERQVNHMVRLVDDLLEVSRITRGKIELRKEPVELAAVLRSAVETSSPLIEANRHQLAITLPSESVILDGDMVRLAQVFANLLNNAAKYTDPGGQIWLTARCEGNEAVVSVRDTGTGIPSELLPKVFDLFIQAQQGTGRTQGGLGIGLTLVKRLVEMHGGSVEARSVLGEGTEFVVRLPVTHACPSTSKQNEARPPAVLAPRRVLVVDDNRDAADSLGLLLKLLGAELEIAYSGPEAMAALRRFRPQVVLLDLGMPGMDGYDVARWVREQPDLRHVTLIALTGWGQEEARRKCRDAGFDHHLIKPADVGLLESLLNSL